MSENANTPGDDKTRLSRRAKRAALRAVARRASRQATHAAATAAALRQQELRLAELDRELERARKRLVRTSLAYGAKKTSDTSYTTRHTEAIHRAVRMAAVDAYNQQSRSDLPTGSKLASEIAAMNTLRRPQTVTVPVGLKTSTYEPLQSSRIVGGLGGLAASRSWLKVALPDVSRWAAPAPQLMIQGVIDSYDLLGVGADRELAPPVEITEQNGWQEDAYALLRDKAVLAHDGCRACADALHSRTEHPDQGRLFAVDKTSSDDS